MSKETDKFLTAEQYAQELVQTLEQLKNETISYKTSTHELESVREKLSKFFDSFLPIVQGIREVVLVLKSTHPEVIDKLDAISLRIDEQSKIIHDELEHKVGILSKQLNRLRLLTIIALSLVVLSIIGIVVLLLR